jgi:hypothetical protein
MKRFSPASVSTAASPHELLATRRRAPAFTVLLALTGAATLAFSHLS